MNVENLISMLRERMLRIRKVYFEQNSRRNSQSLATFTLMVILFHAVIPIGAQDLNKMWLINKENECVKGSKPYPITPIAQLLKNSCTKSKLTKYDQSIPNLIFYEFDCDGSSKIFATASESGCNDLLKYLDISNKEWFIYMKGIVTFSCYSTVNDADYKVFAPISTLKRKGCVLDDYNKQAGLLIIDCKKNEVFSQNGMPSVAYMDSKEKCIESGERLK